MARHITLDDDRWRFKLEMRCYTYTDRWWWWCVMQAGVIYAVQLVKGYIGSTLRRSRRLPLVINAGAGLGSRLQRGCNVM